MARRVAFTVMALALAVGLRLLHQPGIQASLLADPKYGPALTRFTFAGIGLQPYLVVFGVVGFLVVMRRSTAGAPRRLRRAAPFVAGVVALVQAGFVVAWRNHTASFLGIDLPPPGQIVAIGVLGTLALVGCATVVTRLGLGCGVLAVLAADTLAQTGLDPYALVPVVVLVPFLVTALGAHRAITVNGGPPLEIPLSVAGIVPLGLGASLPVLPGALMAAVGVRAAFLGSPWFLAPAMAATAVFAAFFVQALAFRPKPILDAIAARGGQLDLPGPPFEALERAMTSLVFANGALIGVVLVADVAVASLPAPSGGRIAVRGAFFLAAVIAAFVRDALEDAAFWKQHATSANLGEAPELLEATRIRTILRTAGIPVLVRCYSSRSLLWCFGFFAPLDVLVPSDFEARAREVLARDVPGLLPGVGEAPPPEASEASAASAAAS